MSDDIDTHADGEPAPKANVFLWLVIAIGLTLLGSLAWWLR